MQNSENKNLGNRLVRFMREAFQAWIRTPSFMNGFPIPMNPHAHR